MVQLAAVVVVQVVQLRHQVQLVVQAVCRLRWRCPRRASGLPAMLLRLHWRRCGRWERRLAPPQQSLLQAPLAQPLVLVHGSVQSEMKMKILLQRGAQLVQARPCRPWRSTTTCGDASCCIHEPLGPLQRQLPQHRQPMQRRRLQYPVPIGHSQLQWRPGRQWVALVQALQQPPLHLEQLQVQATSATHTS